MDILWSVSTTMRNPERTLSFLKTIAELEGAVWDNETQMKLQSLLIKNRYYTPTFENLTDKQIKIVNNLSYEMTYEEARDIFDGKNYKDAPIRGRTSFDPIEKLGLVVLEPNENGDKIIQVTNFGNMFLNNEIDLTEMVFTNLLKVQFPNPLSKDRKDYNTKPFINILRLIKKVNLLCDELGEKSKGISKEEFGIFALSIKSYLDIDEIAERLLGFRHDRAKIADDKSKKVFVTNFIEQYLSNFTNAVKNVHEYTDNMIRYLRLTKYIYISGGGYYIDLEPRRMIEINAILKADNGAAIEFTLDEYKNYISDYNAYVLPFETTEQLKIIATNISNDINGYEIELRKDVTRIQMPATKEELKILISSLRENRASLQNLILKRDYQDIDKIDDAINALKNINKLDLKPSIALEKWTNIALNIINDAVLIKPNSPMGDDNEPTFTAPAGVADIECFYDGFAAICEVTMLTGRDQWFNEGQPVMRHLRAFENNNATVDNYCLFVAPKLHVDTLNTFWTAVKYEYEGEKQKIIPITISQLIDILEVIKKLKINGKTVKKEDLIKLYNSCISIVKVANSTNWKSHIDGEIINWKTALIA